MKKFLYKIALWIGAGIVSLGAIVPSLVLAESVEFPYAIETGKPTTNIGEEFTKANQGGSSLEWYLNLFGINYADNGQGKAIVYIQVVINYVLALLGFITLVLILYSFYMIFFGKSEDQIGKARKTIIGAAIALFIIGLSAYIVNFIFYVYNRGV